VSQQELRVWDLGRAAFWGFLLAAVYHVAADQRSDLFPSATIAEAVAYLICKFVAVAALFAAVALMRNAIASGLHRRKVQRARVPGDRL